jgi:hypothetical protein
MYKGSAKFYHPSITKVDELMLYNLHPGTGYWKDIYVCENICYGTDCHYAGFKWGSLLALHLVLLILFTI